MEESSYKLALFIARLLNVASISLVSKLPQDPTLRKFLTLMILIAIIKQETLFELGLLLMILKGIAALLPCGNRWNVL